MSKYKSLFGTSVDKLQIMIDKSKSLFAPLWYPKYFDVAPPQQSLTYTSIIGSERIEAAASVVDRDGKTPLRDRAGLAKLTGEIPAIKQMLQLKESDYRDFLAIQGTQGVDDQTKLKQLLDLIWGDVKKCGDAPHKRMDIMVLQALSTGKVVINTTTNPDGIVHDDIDLLMDSANKKTAAVTWATAATATPITDIETVLADARSRGLGFAKILMSQTLWLKFRKAKEVIDTMQAYFYAAKPGGGINPIAITTLDRVNEFMTANQLPVIEIVNESIGVTKDGSITASNYFDANNCTFIPAGKLGTIKNALAIEKLKPVDKVNYADYNKVLISKWSQNEPFGEFTKGEWNAFPSWETIDSCYILTCVF
jgi:hypothetical protein